MKRRKLALLLAATMTLSSINTPMLYAQAEEIPEESVYLEDEEVYETEGIDIVPEEDREVSGLDSNTDVLVDEAEEQDGEAQFLEEGIGFEDAETVYNGEAVYEEAQYETEEELAETEQLYDLELIEETEEEALDKRAEIPEEVYSKTFEQYRAWYYITYSGYDYDINTFEAPYRSFVNDIDDGFEQEVLQWRLYTLGAKTLDSYSTKEIDFYNLMLYELVSDEKFKDSVGDAQKAVDGFEISLWKSMKEYSDLFQKTDQLNDTQKEALKDVIKDEAALQKLFDDFETLDNFLENCADLQSAIHGISMIATLADYSSDIGKILRSTANATNDPLLKQSCSAIGGLCDSSLDETTVIAAFYDDFAATKIYDSNFPHQ